MGFSRQEYQSRLPFPSPGDLTNPGVEPGSFALQEDSLPSEPPGKPHVYKHVYKIHVLMYKNISTYINMYLYVVGSLKAFLRARTLGDFCT